MLDQGVSGDVLLTLHPEMPGNHLKEQTGAWDEGMSFFMK